MAAGCVQNMAGDSVVALGAVPGTVLEFKGMIHAERGIPQLTQQILHGTSRLEDRFRLEQLPQPHLLLIVLLYAQEASVNRDMYDAIEDADVQALRRALGVPANLACRHHDRLAPLAFARSPHRVWSG